MARRTVLVCDDCGKEVGENKGAALRVTFTDARRGSKVADKQTDETTPEEVTGLITGAIRAA